MHVIFVCPHFPAGQRRFVRGLKAVGARVTGLVDAPVHRIDRETLELLDGIEVVPTIADEDAVIAAVKRIQARGPWVHHLEATIEAHTLLAARVREACGIPGLPSATVDRCRDKFVMKQHLAAHGVPCAQHAAVSTAAEARAFAAEVGFPCILKPRGGAGAQATYRLDSTEELEAALAETGLTQGPRSFTMEEFIQGHEGFYDTLTVRGQVAMEWVSHYYPNVLPAMRSPGTPAMIVSTNRVEQSGYDGVRALGRKVIRALDLHTTATHQEWFYGPKGLSFSEIGARPPGVNFWDVYAAIGELDIYAEWARAICWGDVHARPKRRYAGGLLALRPARQGQIQGYSGVEEAQRRFGSCIVKAYLPPRGARTQPVEAGYLSNAWMIVRHPDYDECRGIMETIGRLVQVHAG